MIRFSLCCLLVLSSYNSYSQNNDFQVWNSLRINKKIFKRTNVSIKGGIRFRENSSLISKYFTDIKLSHRIKKTDMSFSLGYRLINEYNIYLSSRYENRLYVDYSHSYKYDRIKLSVRDRMQFQGQYVEYDLLYRQKFDLSYNIRKTPFEPFLEFEYCINQRIAKDSLLLGRTSIGT